MQAAKSSRNRPKKRDTYEKVLDHRKRRVRGLWIRNGRYFAGMTVEDDSGAKSARKILLSGATTLEEAKRAYDQLKTKRVEGSLPVIGRQPKFRAFLEEEYESRLQASGKRETSLQKERGYLRHWNDKLGHLRLNEIRTRHIQAVLDELATDWDYQGRSVNLYLIALRNALKAAQVSGYLKPPLPFEGIPWLKTDTKSRTLVSAGDIDRLCETALTELKNGRQFVDYIRFLQFSGARRSEALRVRWSDVDFERGFLTIGAEGDAKNRKPRTVDLNASLESHLRDMSTRRQPDSRWLFPSPLRGDEDRPANTFQESLKKARKQVGVQLGFHDLRHAFASQCVMAGIDFMTVAKWLGHSDGGMLVAKVYGHLADEHRKRQAAKLKF